MGIITDVIIFSFLYYIDDSFLYFPQLNMEKKMEQRRHPRLNAVGMEIDISDRIGFSTGTLKDISRFGVCITDIPRKLHTKSSLFTVVISNKGKRFKLKLRPQWKKQDGLMNVTGATIENASWNWTEMIMQLEPQNEDIWATN
jgi:hypothetical protein